LPVVRHSLTVSEDLLDMDGEGAMTGRQQAFDPPSQPPAIGPRVGQTTEMADAQAANETVLNELKYLAGGAHAYLRQFRPQGYQFIHIEEAPPVDIVIGGAQVRQPVVLLLEQLMQSHSRLRRAVVVPSHGTLQCGGGRAAGEVNQLAMDGVTDAG